jgi:Ca2+-binding EF-hand superfamily protein
MERPGDKEGPAVAKSAEGRYEVMKRAASVVRITLLSVCGIGAALWAPGRGVAQEVKEKQEEPAPAEKAPGQQKRKLRAEKPQRLKTEMLQRYDVNRNGSLDPSERAALKNDEKLLVGRFRAQIAASRAATLEGWDANKNGVLDPGEKEALKKDRDVRIQRLRARAFAKYDANHDGVLDPSEEEAFAKARARLQKARGKALQRYDANKNGTLDPEERTRMRADREAWLHRLRAQILERFDTNKNGVLDPEEKEAMRSLLRAKKRSAAP